MFLSEESIDRELLENLQQFRVSSHSKCGVSESLGINGSCFLHKRDGDRDDWSTGRKFSSCWQRDHRSCCPDNSDSGCRSCWMSRVQDWAYLMRKCCCWCLELRIGTLFCCAYQPRFAKDGQTSWKEWFGRSFVSRELQRWWAIFWVVGEMEAYLEAGSHLGNSCSIALGAMPAIISLPRQSLAILCGRQSFQELQESSSLFHNARQIYCTFLRSVNTWIMGMMMT